MILKDKIIIFPTDTVYGIGCSIYDYKSLQKIYNIKKRPSHKPIIVLCSSLKQLKNIIVLDDKIQKINDFFWPGPLTLIVNTQQNYFNYEQEKKIGIRIPNHPLALKILEQNGPLRVTSLNISGEKPLNDYKQIKKEFFNKVDLIYPNEQNLSCISSTIIDTTCGEWKYIRKGEITLESIKKIIY
ncbi:L-threonylcarbamoyladenylate synthase [Candidatus Phytoplasma luffae]|uniref:L-threonylcarbamoyladenylate synthase n=1 Tax=Loofah witches'-broom phytoplasma TaxID=35773 RepID=A0A975ILX4_LOWBP|nr:L-threonylcarbamoyladenylate synthase [Candidatus Phytoplasma luffae]QTX02887.1 L-threonylcarbamoyladenylate synthase [Candidatus Phytoplasma luffae]QTX03014.1 L-threonylcarbamoyladenylate synthase [Candidatus Phytoplasma luffae]